MGASTNCWGALASRLQSSEALRTTTACSGGNAASAWQRCDRLGHNYAYPTARLMNGLSRSKSPMMFFRSTNSDSRIGHDLNVRDFPRQKVMARIAAQIDLVMPRIDIKRLRQLAGTGTQPFHIVHSASRFHQVYSALRFERANQDQSISRSAFDQNIEHPMDAVVKINVASSRFVPLYETARTRAAKGV